MCQIVGWGYGPSLSHRFVVVGARIPADITCQLLSMLYFLPDVCIEFHIIPLRYIDLNCDVC